MSNLPQRTHPISKDDPYSICFVCLGNICRSPTAEGIFLHQVKQAGFLEYFEIDSAGTSAFHAGEPANSKSQQVANQRGFHLPSRARQLAPADLDHFDLILAMDNENLANIRAMAHTPEHREKIMRMRDFDPQPDNGEVPDPYYGGMKGFENVFDMLERSSRVLLDELSEMIGKKV